MNEEMKKMLMDHGIDMDGILGRLPGREDLIKRLLLKFPNEECFKNLEKAVADKDYKAAFEHSHNLKGVSANLEMKVLYESTCVLVEKLRAGNYDDAGEDFEAIRNAYDNVMQGIEILGNL